ncbi:anti-sigma factor family protein [Paraburkholderia tagetis]|uniref:Anti-sigma factor n=1 Tax=Paraburkholderia tagetis TaxID=2913261 RepID=A0A9X1UKC4_9BURK|nr:anti-sigma factor [Paraburkholderia tagetis]MCG5073391.1 anti-sigma factor [Paraburkholderia tagetis]
MDCKDARPLLDASVDRELSPPDEHRLQQHVEGCDACRRESEAVRAISRAVRRAEYYRAPEGLRAQIAASLPAAPLSGDTDETRDRETPARKRRRFAWLDGWQIPHGGGFGTASGSTTSGRGISAGWLTGLAIALCAVAAGVVLTLPRHVDSTPFVDELVSSHVRAQLSGRDIDVISSDQHTVKPWFNGRIDYAPPVEDLTASGFPLVGGRLDYLGHRRVAVLTYHYRKHVIDVYVFPDSDQAVAGPAEALGREGYALARWHDNGMTWWAITDAAPDALTAFETALKARLHGSG